MNENNARVPVKEVIPIDQLFGDDAEDTELLQGMASEARAYLLNFAWCKEIRHAYYGDGYGGIVAVFLFQIEPAKPDVDEWLWIVVGDLPSAYLVIDDNTSPALALEGYIEEMSKWVKLAKVGRSSKKVIPVNVLPTAENAEILEGRLKLLGDVVVPAFRARETIRG